MPGINNDSSVTFGVSIPSSSVAIQAGVVDGSNTKIHANPIYPVQNPVNVPAEDPVDLSAPVNIPEESAGTLSAPNPITPNALDPEVAPFPLNHARILYDNKLIGSSVTTTTGTNPSYTLIPNTAQRWTFTATVADDVVYTLPANLNIDTVCIMAHNIGSTGGTVQAFYDVDDLGSDFVALTASQTPVNDNAIMFHVDTAVSARRIKVLITGASGSVFVGAVYAGIALQMQRPFYGGHTPAVLARQADYYSSNTESGNFIGVEVRRRALESNADWKNITDTWYRANFVPFLASAEVLPFVFAWNLLEHPTDVAYCKNITNIAPTYTGQRNLVSFGIPLVGIA